MRRIIQWKWPITAGLIVLTAVLFVLAPNLSKQAEKAGSFQLPDEADSQRAIEILDKAGAGAETISLVFPLDGKLNESSRRMIAKTVKELADLGSPVQEVMNPFENKEMEEQLISKDRKTVLVPLTVDGTEEEVNELADEIRSAVLPKDTTVYLTGEAIINNDVNISAQEGLKRTEVITVVLIFALLLAVFRSVVTPFVPLLAVGITYLLSQSVVAFFIEWFDFPVSNYTQIFLVAVLFGIGTDYCILLLSRYKEELLAGHAVEEAIVNTYKTAGRTLLISGLAVFIGFSAIGFADFPIFKSAVGVAVGIAVLLLVLFTVVPFFMAVLKDKLFWPSKQSAGHRDSKLWLAFGGLSVKRPLLSMLVVAIIAIPLLFTYDNQLSYNTVDEIGSDYDSVKGLEAIEEGFGKGDSLPVQVILKEKKEAVSESTVPYIESISREIEKEEGVKEVRTITRPAGDVMDELYIDHQLGEITQGLKKAQDGFVNVQKGLTDVQAGLNGMAGQLPAGGEASAGAGDLGQAAQGIGQINQQLGLLSKGLQQTQNIPQAVQQLGMLQQQLGQVQQGIAKAGAQVESSTGQIGQMKGGLTELSKGVGAANRGLSEIKSGLNKASSVTAKMSQSESLRDTGMFIPAGTLAKKDFQPVLDRYAIGRKSGVLLEVILADDPYSPQAIDTVKRIKEAAERSAAGTPFEEAEVAYGGVSSMNSDLQEISSADFTRTVTIMLVSLIIVLSVLFRSFIMPLYMMGSLLLAYFTSVSAAELVFVNWLGYDGISWAVPFFGFVMLVALGIDYSIFLLDRFREEAADGASIPGAMLKSMAKMGTVIMTAAIILAGTFAAMMPSGVLSLVQIAAIVITGLLLYGLIILPLLIPAITVSFGQGAWWPFKSSQQALKRERDSAEL
ncbi:MMPL family transporter [Bacillus xiapuensis]|uniref:MMPL family transporter n=1 Tax=Bacillus xiapuensis TaxID=2014075 RepID=UPI000C23741F|nr:MMPL family transporter [Bacillus xiapuensis]